MKNLIIICTTILVLGACTREDVKPYAATEEYPNDSTLEQIINKRAMVIIAHDDDMCSMTGTISILNKAGWQIKILSLEKSEERNKAHLKAAKKLATETSFLSLSSQDIYRKSMLRDLSYEAFPKDSFPIIFKMELLKEEIKKEINAFKPEVIFSLDNEFGGYGHPEHILVSQTVLDLALAKDIGVSYIYQNVFTDHMEQSIMTRHSRRMKSWGFDGEGWERAKKIYKKKGMPEPSVQVKIELEAQVKMDYLLSYNERERKTMSFFIPAFEEYEAEEYFSIFDREFFRVVKLD